MQRLVSTIAILAITGYVVICIALYFYQRQLIYFPQPRANTNAPTLALPTDEGTTLVTVREHQGTKALLFFGGNADDASGYLPQFSTSHPSHAIYLMHYRGYGGSSGAPTENALFTDALSLFDLAYAKHKAVIVVGRSLGSGVAAYVASVRPVAKLILVTPYDSIERVAAGQFPWVPVSLLLKDKYESWRYAPKITAPTLLVAAANDSLIPAKHTLALLGTFSKGIATMKTIANVDHNSIGSDTTYLALLAAF